MTAHPTACLVDYEDGYRLLITIEDGDAESGAVAALRFSGELSGKPVNMTVQLSGEAATLLCHEMYARTGDDPSGPARSKLHAVEHELTELRDRVQSVIERGPRFTDGPMESAADSVIEELRAVLDGEKIA